MSTNRLSRTPTRFILQVAVALLMPASEIRDGNAAGTEVDNGWAAQGRPMTIRYEGPLIYDQNCIPKRGHTGHDKQKFHDLVSTCPDMQSIDAGIQSRRLIRVLPSRRSNQERTLMAISPGICQDLMWKGRFSTVSAHLLHDSRGFSSPSTQGDASFLPNDPVTTHLLTTEAGHREMTLASRFGVHEESVVFDRSNDHTDIGFEQITADGSDQRKFQTTMPRAVALRPPLSRSGAFTTFDQPTHNQFNAGTYNPVDGHIPVRSHRVVSHAAFAAKGRAAQSISSTGSSSEEWRQWVAKAYRFEQQGDYPRAIEAFRIALDQAEQSGKPSAVAHCLDKLATGLMVIGRYLEAEKLLRRQAAIVESFSDPPHLSQVWTNLSRCLWLENEIDEAEVLCRRALDLQRHSNPPDDAKLAGALNVLAIVEYERGRYTDSEAISREELTVRQKQLSNDVSGMAANLLNLATVTVALGRYVEAEGFAHRALAICEKTFGKESVSAARSLSNLSLVYIAEEQYGQAEKLLARTMSVLLSAFGSHHPDTLSATISLGIVYIRESQFDKADRLLQQAAADCEKWLGPGHPQTAVAINNLALVKHAEHRYEEAEPLYLRALSLEEHLVGSRHVAVARILINLAMVYQDEKRYQIAEPYYQRALKIIDEKLGPSHPDAATVLYSYAQLLRKMHRKDEARRVAARARTVQAAMARNSPQYRVDWHELQRQRNSAHE